NDTYRFRGNFGHDLIDDTDGDNIIDLEHIAEENATFNVSGDGKNLIINIGNDSIAVKNFFDGNEQAGSGANQTVRFSNNASLSFNEIQAKVYPPPIEEPGGEEPPIEEPGGEEPPIEE